MTQAFADEDLTGGSLLGVSALTALGPAMTAGKGTRAVRCVGCSHPTLPRQDDGAPLCRQCSEVLSGVVQPARFLPLRRFRRRPHRQA